MAIVKLAIAWAHRIGSVALGVLLAIAVMVPIGSHVFKFWQGEIAAYTTPAAPAKKVVAR